MYTQPVIMLNAFLSSFWVVVLLPNVVSSTPNDDIVSTNVSARSRFWSVVRLKTDDGGMCEMLILPEFSTSVEDSWISVIDDKVEICLYEVVSPILDVVILGEVTVACSVLLANMKKATQTYACKGYMLFNKSLNTLNISYNYSSISSYCEIKEAWKIVFAIIY